MLRPQDSFCVEALSIQGNIIQGQGNTIINSISELFFVS